MIISRTPFRVSFLGGGTDYPAWYLKHGGAVLGTSINKYCYITCRYLPPFFEHRLRVVYSQIETCHTADEISHPAVRAVLKHVKCDRGLEIHHDGDLPARSGMGSSSAFTVGLLNAMYALQGKMIGKHQLSLEAMHIERDVLKETVGSQDQVLAAYGGFNRVAFSETGEITVAPVTISPIRTAMLADHLLLYYTGVARIASNIAASYVPELCSKQEAHIHRLRRMVDEAVDILSSSDDLSGFGELLHEAWHIKRSLSKAVTNSRIDAIYDASKEAGAIGGKLIGAGGGGFILLFAPPSRHASIKERLKDLIHVPFRFENSGSHIVYYDVEEDFQAHDVARMNRKQMNTEQS